MTCQSPEIVASRSAFGVGVKAEWATADFAAGVIAAASGKPSAKAAFILNPQFDSVGQVAIVEPSGMAGRRGADKAPRRLSSDCPAWSGTKGIE